MAREIWLGRNENGEEARFVLEVSQDGERWTSIDPLSHVTEISVHHHVPVDFDLAGWLEARGNRVLKAPMRRNITRAAPFMLFTCVEAVKRVLGIHSRGIFTPWQLYRHLKFAT